MAIIEISPFIMTAMIQYNFSPGAAYPCNTVNAASPYFCGIPGGGSSTVMGIHIMQGTPPTDFTGLTTFAARASDELMFFNAMTPGIFVGTYTNNRWTLNTPLVNALNSGTATWFWGLNTVNPGTSSSLINQQMIGTVGVVGSGADLTITSTSIVSGNPYRITSLMVAVPNTYTV